MVTGLAALEEALEISAKSIEIAHDIVQYSDQIAQLLHNFVHSKFY